MGARLVEDAKQQRATRNFVVFYLVLASAWWLYLIGRAVMAPPVFDELTTYYLYIRQAAFWPGQGYWTANNHFLNTALTYLCYRLGGDAIWVLRMPGLLAFPIFAYFTLRLLQHIRDYITRYWAAVVIFSLHLLLEFFAYSRGYALAFTSLAISLYLLLRLHRQYGFTALMLLAMSIFCMVFANLSTLPLAGLITLAGLYLLWFGKRGWPEKALGTTLLLQNLIWGAVVLRELAVRRELYFGGQSGFWEDSLVSLQENFFGEASLATQLLTALFAIILVLLCFQAIRHGYYRRKDHQPAMFLLASSLAIVLFYILAHHLFGIRFPLGRTLLYWLLLTLLALFFAVYTLPQRWRQLLLIPTLAFPLVAGSHLSIYSSNIGTWDSEQVPADWLHSLPAHSTLGGNYLLEPQWVYTLLQNARSAPFLQSSDSTQQYFDYLLMQRHQLPSYEQNYRIAQQNRSDELLLLERRKRLEKEQIDREVFPDTTFSKEWLAFRQMEWPPGAGVWGLSIQGEIQLSGEYFRGQLAFQAKDSSGQSQYWQDFQLGRSMNKQKGWQSFRLFVILDDVPAESSDRMMILLWNIDHQDLKLRNVETSLWRLKEGEQ